MTVKAITLVSTAYAPTPEATQYACPANSQVIVRHAVFCNITAGALTLTVYVLKSGGSIDNESKVLDAFSIAGHTAYVSPELSGIVLNAGDGIHTLASAASSITQNISGVIST